MELGRRIESAMLHPDLDPMPQSAIAGSVVIVVVGAAGTPEYATQFAAWAELWEQACAKSNAKFVAIGLDERGASIGSHRIQQILADQSEETTAALWLVLIGHGTFDGRTAKFNLRGPDLSASDLADWLKPLHRPVVVIDTASSSAPFLKELSAPGRVIITATKSGFEQNFTRFGQYLAEAIIDPTGGPRQGRPDLPARSLSQCLARRQRSSTPAPGGWPPSTPCSTTTATAWARPPSGSAASVRCRGRADDAALDGHRAHQLHLLNSPARPPCRRSCGPDGISLNSKSWSCATRKRSSREDEYFSKLEPLLREIAQIYEQVDKSGSTNQ